MMTKGWGWATLVRWSVTSILLSGPVNAKGAGSDSTLSTTTDTTAMSYRWFCDITQNPIVTLTWDPNYQTYVVTPAAAYDTTSDVYFGHSMGGTSSNSSGDDIYNGTATNRTEENNGAYGIRRRQLQTQDGVILGSVDNGQGDGDDIMPLMQSTTSLRSGSPDFDVQEHAILALSQSSHLRRSLQTIGDYARAFSPSVDSSPATVQTQQEPTPPSHLTIEARACHCWNSAVWDGTYYCSLPRTHCAVPITPVGMPGCVDEKNQRRLVRSIWPVLVVWYASVVFCLAFTHTGRNAISCLIASVFPRWNDGVARRLLIHDPHEANHMLLRHYRLMRRRRERREARQRRRRRQQGLPEEDDQGPVVVANTSFATNPANNNDDIASNITTAGAATTVGPVGDSAHNVEGNNNDNTENNNRDAVASTLGNSTDSGANNNTDTITNNNHDTAALRQRLPFWRRRRQREEEEPLPSLWQLAILPRPPIQFHTGQPMPTELALKTRIYRSSEHNHKTACDKASSITRSAPSGDDYAAASPNTDHLQTTDVMKDPDIENEAADEATVDEVHGAEPLDIDDIKGIEENEAVLDTDCHEENGSHDHDLSEWDDSACTICYGPLEDGDRVGALPCTHIFHVECLKGWLTRRNVCPLCLHENVATPRYHGSEEPPPATDTPFVLNTPGGGLAIDSPFDYGANIWAALNLTDPSVAENGGNATNFGAVDANNGNAADTIDDNTAGAVEMQNLARTVPPPLVQEPDGLLTTETTASSPRIQTGIFSAFSRQRGHE